MVTFLLTSAYLVSIAVAFGIGLYVLRGNRFTLAGLAVATVLVATVMWSAISLVSVYYPFTADSEYPVRVLAWGAVLVAGVRSLVKVLEDPAWSPRPLDVVNLTAHPWVMVFIATIPSLHPLLVDTDADGKLTYTVGFWIHSAVLLTLSGKLLGGLFDRSRRLPRTPAGTRYAVFISWTLPAAGYVISAQVWGPSGPGLAPAFLVIPVALIGSAVVRDGLIDKVPLARGDVFENLAGAVFVIDNYGRVVDANAAARALAWDLDGANDMNGAVLEEVCPRTAHVMEREGDVDVLDASRPRVLNTQAAPLVDGRGKIVGRCVTVRDVTESAMQQRDLERMRDALSHEVTVSEELRAELGDQVMRDSATGLYNRRFLSKALPELVKSCIGKGCELSVAVLDIDGFKDVNDSHGHVAGDRMIEAVATALRDAAPGGTVVRYGGDEFLALMPGVSARDALVMTEAMRTAGSEVRIGVRGGEIQVTVSAGVATLVGEEIDGDELLEVADLALYRAKDGGRNRTWSQVDGAD